MSKHSAAAHTQLQSLSEANQAMKRACIARIRQRSNENWGSRFRDRELPEVSMFANQSRYIVPRREREAALEKVIKKIRREFRAAENMHEDALRDEMVDEIRARGVEEASRKMVPAYAFHKFRQLPVELQRRVWSFAARFSEPNVYRFGWQCPWMMWRDRPQSLLDVYDPQKEAWQEASSYFPDYYPTERQIPTVLHVCQLSRKVGLGIFHLFSWDGLSHKNPRSPCTWAYFNTLYGTFHIARNSLPTDSPILRCLLLKLSKESLSGERENYLNGFFADLQRIRNLSVAVNVFAKMPSEIWSLMGNLENLKVVLWCYEDEDSSDEDLEQGEESRKFHILVPHSGNKWGRRAAWLFEETMKSLEAAKSESPKWTLPKVEVVVEGESWNPSFIKRVSNEDNSGTGSLNNDQAYFDKWVSWRAASVDPILMEEVLDDYKRMEEIDSSSDDEI